MITPRFPWPPYTGDRLRSTIWLSALERVAEVTLVAPRGSVPDNAPRFRFIAARRSLSAAIRGAIALITERIPLQCLLAAPFDWRGAIAQARRDAGPFDATVVLLSRMHPWVKGSLDGRRVLDAVDSLGRNAAERANAAGPLTRWLWRIEQRRMARLERGMSRAYDEVVVINDDERADFGDAVAVGNGIATAPPGDAPRAFDFGFWGRLPYFANADAVRWILDEIWPAIRARHPAATLVIGGAGASAALRDQARKQNVTLVSPIDDVAAFARTIRVVLLPLRFGTGQSNKVLEAAEASCAIVATPQAVRGLASLARLASLETTAEELARKAVDLLRDGERRSAAAASLRGEVEMRYARSNTLDRFAAIVAGDTP